MLFTLLERNLNNIIIIKCGKSELQEEKYFELKGAKTSTEFYSDLG